MLLYKNVSLSLFLLLFLNFVSVSQEMITLLKFASQWGPHYCFVHPNSKCKANIPNEFTLHGIWPDGFPPPPRRGCNLPGPAYKPSIAYKHIVGGLQAELSKTWPDLSGKQTPYGQKFWKYQWDKHGTCSANKYNLTRYFSLAPQFCHQYNLSQILQARNIHCCKGIPHRGEDIRNAIVTKTWRRPDLRCQFVRRINRLLLVEIIICLDINNLKVIDCPNPSNSCYRMSVTY